MKRWFLVTFVFAAITSTSVFPQIYDKFDKNVSIAIQQSSQEEITAWIFFTDKGNSLAKKLQSVEDALTSNAYQRRLRNRGTGNLVDEFDIPVYGDYNTASFTIRHQKFAINPVG